MQRCCRNLDKKVVEEGISQTILTLPLKQQQTILLSWFDRFSSSGDDCPNLQKAFEVWWRRTFTRPSVEEDNCGPQPSFWAPKGLGHTERWLLLLQACIRTSLERCICCYMWSWAIICWEEDLRFDLLGENRITKHWNHIVATDYKLRLIGSGGIAKLNSGQQIIELFRSNGHLRLSSSYFYPCRRRAVGIVGSSRKCWWKSSSESCRI